MVDNMLTMGINIVLDLLFICTFGWGIFGAALASGISAAIVFVLFLTKFVRKDSILKIGLCHFDFPALLHMAFNGSSEANPALRRSFKFNYQLVMDNEIWADRCFRFCGGSI